MTDEKLTRDDLVLLMESYRNMITMHQTILAKTEETANILSDVAKKLDSSSSNIMEEINVHEKKSIEEHGKIRNRINYGWVGMGSIMISLIGLIIILFKYILTNTP